MSVKVRVEQSPLKIRVGQADAIKILSTSPIGSSTTKNVVGGAASVTSLNVTGISTFTGNISANGITTANTLNITGTTTANIMNVTGTLTAGLIDGGSFWWQNQALDKDLLTTVFEN